MLRSPRATGARSSSGPPRIRRWRCRSQLHPPMDPELGSAAPSLPPVATMAAAAAVAVAAVAVAAVAVAVAAATAVAEAVAVVAVTVAVVVVAVAAR